MPLDFGLLGEAPRINTPFENLSQILQIRNQQEAAAGQREYRQGIAEKRRAEAEQIQQDAVRAARLRDLFTANPNPTSADIIKADGTEHGVTIAKGLDALRDAELKRYKDQKAVAHDAIAGLDALPEALRAGGYGTIRQTFLMRGWATPEQIPEDYNPAYVASIKKSLLSPDKRYDIDNPKPLEVTAGASLMSPDGKVIGTAPAAPSTAGKPSSVQEYEYAVTQGFKGSFEDYQNADANRKQRAASERAPYFTYQTTYDPQGRPDGAIRFDARGGPPQRVGVGDMGGQLKPPPGDLGKQSILDEVSTAQLDRLKTMFNQGAAALVGPASGRMLSMGQKVPGVPVNKTFAEFDAASSAFKNSVIKAITGAALSEAEATRIREQIPEVTDKPAVWLAKAKQTRQNLGDLAERLKAKGTTAAPETPEHRVWRVGGKIGPEPK